MFLNYKFSSCRSLRKVTEENNPPSQKKDTHILKKPQCFMQWQARCKKPSKIHTFLHHSSSEKSTLKSICTSKCIWESTPTLHYLMLYTFITHPLVFNNFLCKTFIQTQKRCKTNLGVERRKDNHFRHSVKMKFI